jgi:ankyrin repeat protein
MIDHLRARYYVHMGEPQQALETYSNALEGAQYRHGPMTKEILGELLIVAAYLKNKRIAKKWDAWAKAFGLEPKIRNPIDAYVQRFPISSYYQEANTGIVQKQHNKRIDQTVISLDEWSKRPPDLRNPNRWISGFGSVKKTQLMLFSGLGHTDNVQKLLRSRADPNLVAEDGNTALMRAVLNNKKECFDVLLPLTDTERLNSVYERTGVSALSDAVDGGKLYYLEELLKAGANTEIKISFSPELTPLYMAVQRCATLDMGSFNLQSDEAMEAALRFMPAPLIPAGIPFAQGQYDAMRTRLQNMMQNPRHRNIFEAVNKHYATGQGIDAATRLEVVEKLLKYHADSNAEHENGFAPLLLAAELGLWDVFELMLKRGGDIKLITDANQTVLHLALWKGHFEFSLKLLRNASKQDRKFLISQSAANGSSPIDWFRRNSARNNDAVEHELLKILCEA